MFLDSGCVACDEPIGPLCSGCESRLGPAGAISVDGLDACRGFVRLDPRSRELIAAFKYRRQRRVASWLSSRMVDLVPLGADCITWLPSTPERRRSRGYDQGHELARALGRIAGVPVVELLERASTDQRQTGRSRVERSAGPNLSAAATCPEFVVIVDDVVTTGASLKKASVSLRKSGAARVVGLVAASTPLSARALPSKIRLWK